MGLGELEILNHVTLTAAADQFRYGKETEIVDFFCPPGQARARTDSGTAFAYDILKASCQVAKPKAEGAPSKRVALTPAGQVSGRCISMAEHKMLDGAAILNLREPGTRQVNAKSRIARELKDLDRRRARLRNFAVAQMLTGTLTINEDDIKASVDYKVTGTHIHNAAASWATAGTDIPAHIDGDVELMEKDSGFTPLHALCDREVMRSMMANTAVKSFLGQADYVAQIGKLGFIQNFHGIIWHVLSGGYRNTAGAFVPWIAAGHVVYCPDPSPDWVDIIEGSAMINPLGATDLVEMFGQHSYTILSSDPAGYKLVNGDTFIPKLTVPDALIYVDTTP